MFYIGTVTVPSHGSKNNRNTATPFKIDDLTTVVWLESDTAGVQAAFSYGVTDEAGDDNSTFAPTATNAANVATNANVPFGPIGIGAGLKVVGINNATSGTANVKVFGARR